ncbi:DNA-directed DNA polymerase [Caerostris extrusa]|uniref:DNA-directed DNA polymerase n=1 Tax=Caerostris extrusa TaxID=172846 RepID=A0AAV4WLW7_CAEEX|nr:DNA-directed DNA polymerase [Caerostris extrusa]
MSCPPGQPQRCKDCDRLCVSESCYQAHKTVTGKKKEKSLCDKLCENFCAWLFTPEHKGFTAIAHNMKGFDGQFIMAWILKQGMTPDVIPNGGLIMSILHPSLKIRIIDSLNFLPMPLSKIPDCFGFKELRKGYFPHLLILNKTKITKEPFLKPDFTVLILWDQQSDVDILRRCCLEFRGQFQEITQVDPFQYVTIASACMAVFRSLHVTPNTIAMVPIHGYVNDIRYSPDSIRWLDFVSHNENIVILHALNGTGEKKIHGIFVDGYCLETNTVYQFHECFYHGCPICYDPDSVHPLKGISMATVKENGHDLYSSSFRRFPSRRTLGA